MPRRFVRCLDELARAALSPRACNQYARDVPENAFRLRNLSAPADQGQKRLRAVLLAAAERFGWTARRSEPPVHDRGSGSDHDGSYGGQTGRQSAAGDNAAAHCHHATDPSARAHRDRVTTNCIPTR